MDKRPAADNEANRNLMGFWTCTALAVGNTIAIGIFMMPTVLAPYGVNALIAWGITTAGCLVLAGVFARLSGLLPNADGAYGYIRATQGDATAFLVAWCYWVSQWMTNAVIVVGLVAYIQAAAPVITASVPAPVLALGLIWLFVLINLLGLRTSGPVQVLTTIIKLLPMAAVVMLGAWYIGNDPASHVVNLPATPISVQQIMAASTIALFAMLGFESAAVPAHRIKDPGRTIARATLFATLVTAAIYIAILIVPMLVMPQAELMGSQAPFVDLLDRLLGAGAGRWLALFVVVSGMGAINGWTLLVGELTRTMALNGALPRIFARENRNGAPAFALISTGILASLMVLMNYSKSLVQGFAFLSTMVTAANLPLYLFSAASLVMLARKERLSSALASRTLGGIGAAYSVFAFGGMGLEPLGWSLALALAGAVVYIVMRLPPRKEDALSVVEREDT